MLIKLKFQTIYDCLFTINDSLKPNGIVKISLIELEVPFLPLLAGVATAG